MSGALTLGVIGHVDHGKTALVRALTGTETDLLKEERERGLSIVLGFAYLETGNGVVDLIDVPGHEDFVRAMVAGATALDAILLCVAANESVMPQTVEHFNIARLLGVERGFVVVTKTDLVDAERLALLRQEIEALTAGSFLADAPVIETSATSGSGIDSARAALEHIAATPVARESRKGFFLPLDRVFTMQGFGLVATGTLRGAALSIGDTVQIQPTGKCAAVRALQNHNRPVERAAPGQRVAVNLRHVGRHELRRGNVLATPGTIEPTRCADVELRLLGDVASAVRNGALVRFLTGTTEAMARIRLLDRRELEPGATAMAQVRLDREIATVASERFLVRSNSPVHTIGGGRILAVNAARHRRFDPTITRRLETLASGDLEQVIQQRLEEAGAVGIDLVALAEDLGVRREAVDGIRKRPGIEHVGANRAVASSAYDSLLGEILERLEAFHDEHPHRNGIDAGSLAGALGIEIEPDVLRHALEDLAGRGEVRRSRGVLSLAGFDPFERLGERERKLVREIERTFRDRGLEPPSPQAVIGSDEARRGVFRLLLDSGRLVRLRTYKTGSSPVLHSRTLEDARHAIEREFPYPKTFALKDIRDLLGSTRKHVVPLMEHLDATGTTVRSGDMRRLREHR